MATYSMIPTAVEDFINATMTRETPAQARLRAETARHARSYMLLSPDVGALLALLVRMSGAKKVLELGTFTGYSALTMALALPADGTLIACDVSREWTDVGRRYWREADVAHKIELRLAPALDSLAALVAEGAAESFDLVFIDAEKTEYPAYYEQCLRLVRSGGLIIIDNMLWYGTVAEAKPRDAVTAILRALNLQIRADERVDAVLLSVGDGVLLAQKRALNPVSAH